MYYLGCQPSISLSPVHLMNLLFALTNFKLYHPVLFEKLAESVIGEMNRFEPHMASSVLTSVGVAKFRHPKLLDTLTEYFHQRLDTVSPSDLSSLVITLANLNYQPQTLSEYFPKFLSRLRPLQLGDRKTWLDVVWSAAILNRLSSEMAESVLTPEFYSGFSELDSFRAAPCHLKLANISALVKCDLPNYSGPMLPDDYLKTKDLNLSKRSKRPFHTMILETLLNFAPGEKYAATNVMTPSGSTIDVELVINRQGEVLPLTDKKPEVGETRSFRIAVRVNDFQDMTIYTVVPDGVSVVSARLLKELGYKTVEVTYHDFPIKTTVVNKVAYLQGKIKEAAQ
ncbi:FAST kinase domain-containing protein 4-like isoform X2 [Lineus longissimus]|uniref:FAST kinase domain-containing protein 4-like isoform X2 n=1 Tax=Lineus longissimus TaxID=88925 RepID=UPI00315D88F5